ncbi:MAG TPA: PAS domain-containing hybrid sensor histidine kinase/response regulator, partial [Rudaea sp.]|nr:PAS domain-containing hybrid sensor histidine kinase/response regulator [Rudaea sp.]
SHRLAALVTVIAVTASIPYLALQFKAVAMSIDALSGRGTANSPVLGDSALYVAVLLAMFAILFGTRRIDATEHHHGMMLAIAAESVVKLVAFVAIGIYAFAIGGFSSAIAPPLHELQTEGLPTGFFSQILLAYVAMFCLPRQFQVGVVECEDPSDVKYARRLFPAYLIVVCILVLPIVAVSATQIHGEGISPDAYLLWLPASNGHTFLAMFAYLGGFSAATGMVIVECVALSTMISNDLVIPAMLRLRGVALEQRNDLSSMMLKTRRVAIVLLVGMAYLYYRAITKNANLASIGLLSFVALAQFAPAIVSALYWRGASRIGVITGLCAGFSIWIYTLLLPSLAEAGLIAADWVHDGPFGITWLQPHALFQLHGWDAITHGAFWSLLANVGCLIFLSLRFRPTVEDRLRASTFIDPYAERITSTGEWRGRIPVADLRALAGRILGEENAHRAFAEYAASTPAQTGTIADRALLQFTERLLAGAIGAASARRMLTSALRGTGLDLSEAAMLLDETSQELRFSRELIAVTFENMSQGISVVDANLCIVAWNRRYLDLFDYPEGFVYVGRPVADLIRYNAERQLLGEGVVDRQVQSRLDHLREGAPHVFVRERPDGRVIETRGGPLPGGGYLTAFSDITDYKRAELALREANENLEQRVAQRTRELREALAAQEIAKREAETANAGKTRFLAAASHDLLQPLNAARLFTSALRHQPLDPESAQLAERADAAFKAAEDLLDSLLEASRLDAGKLTPEVSSFALSDITEPLKHQFSVVAAARNLDLRFVGSHARVISDPQLLRRILQNLLSNALRYTRRGTVLFGVRRLDSRVRIEVWDTGVGIDAEQQRSIFDEFRRGQFASPWGEKGLGLGLAICERMANMLGHRLSLRSWPGRGSVFAVEVARAAPAPAAPALRQRATAPGIVGGLHVLCLDNDSAILDGMAALLKRWGVTCDICNNVEEATKVILRHRPDLILADYHLDDPIDGLEALDHLRSLCVAPPPGALITADSSPELKARAKTHGYAVLLKPVKPAALRALIAQLGRVASRIAAPAMEALT